MEVAPRYTLFTLLTLFSLFIQFSLFKLLHCFMYAYILLGKVSMLLECADGFLGKILDWMDGVEWIVSIGYPLDCYDY